MKFQRLWAPGGGEVKGIVVQRDLRESYRPEFESQLYHLPAV